MLYPNPNRRYLPRMVALRFLAFHPFAHKRNRSCEVNGIPASPLHL